MNVNILQAEMTHADQEGYRGRVTFEVEGHKQPYELTLQSDERVDDWNYSLHFAGESGSEQEIEAVDLALEEDGELFDRLVEAALRAGKA
ncbi:hypothetical protein [Cohnella caldifontis]|uniref:hypothetical protein n=1 Tax=Cohnella caldifontis TaxID=3027471 RepID=UPI0023EB5FD6|nr:hypothetical protein [Cohnella sp. YIM B05605]